MTPAGAREPRAVPPNRALLWFAEAIRLWKRGPLAFSLMAVAVIAASFLSATLAGVGVLVANIVGPLLACGFLYGSLAADRHGRPRFVHLFAVFTAPWRAQLAIVAASLAVTAVESAIAWSIAGVDPFEPLGQQASVEISAILVLAAIEVVVSLPLLFVPMAVLFDGERAGTAFSVSIRAFSRNVAPLFGLAGYAFVLLLAGIATSGIGLVLALPWLACASYAAWKDVFGVAE